MKVRARKDGKERRSSFERRQRLGKRQRHGHPLRRSLAKGIPGAVGNAQRARTAKTWIANSAKTRNPRSPSRTGAGERRIVDRQHRNAVRAPLAQTDRSMLDNEQRTGRRKVRPEVGERVRAARENLGLDPHVVEQRHAVGKWCHRRRRIDERIAHVRAKHITRR